ncbi:MAG: hypothetical protein ACJ798_16320 [Phenylobacterium sp.]
MTDREKQPQDGDKGQIQGEGNYDAARKFDRLERAFVENEAVEQKAREAEEALDGPEGEELERARKETGERGHMSER